MVLKIDHDKNPYVKNRTKWPKYLLQEQEKKEFGTLAYQGHN